MYQQPGVSVAEGMVALDAMLKAAPSKTKRAMGVAIVNRQGQLICFAAMDGATGLVREVAFKKAYTAATFGMDTTAFVELMKTRGRIVVDWGDPKMVGLPLGGLVVTLPNSDTVLGGIGVSGGTPEEDEEVAQIGLAVLKPLLQPK